MTEPRNYPSRAHLRSVYDRIYREEHPVHPQRGALAPYGGDGNRDQPFLEFISRKVRTPAKVLDASCGRGHMARAIQDLGYEVHVSEISSYLCREVLPRDFKMIFELDYHELAQLPRRFYDVVCSNDVLEHLPGEGAVREAVDVLAGLSCRWLLLSLGLGAGAHKYPTVIGESQVPDLHLFTPGAAWWLKYLPSVGRIVSSIETRKTLWVFMKVKDRRKAEIA